MALVTLRESGRMAAGTAQVIACPGAAVARRSQGGGAAASCRRHASGMTRRRAAQ